MISLPDHARDPGARVRRDRRRLGPAPARLTVGRGRDGRARPRLPGRAERRSAGVARRADRPRRRRRLLAVLHPPRARGAPQGRGPEAALDATAATVGRAVVVSGVTVMVALAGCWSPACRVHLDGAGDDARRRDRGARLAHGPARGARAARRPDRHGRPPVPRPPPRRAAGIGAWGGSPASSRAARWRRWSRPSASLGALAVPALDMNSAESTPAACPPTAGRAGAARHRAGVPRRAERRRARRHRRAARRARRPERLRALGERAVEVTGGRGAIAVDVARDGRTALVSVPMPDCGVEAGRGARSAALRDRSPAGDVAPGAARSSPARRPASVDFTDRLRTATPIVIGFVLGLALVLLLAAFRSLAWLARGGGRAEPAVGRRDVRRARRGLPARLGRGPARLHEHGAIVSVGAAVRVRDPVRAVDGLHDPGARADPRGAPRGRSRRARRREGVGATAGTVTSAAVVMVADLRDLRDAAAARHEAARRRARGGGADRRDDRARGRAAGGRRAARRARLARPPRPAAPVAITPRVEVPATMAGESDAAGAAASPAASATARPRCRCRSPLSAVVGFAATAIWALTGSGYYWPGWVWFGAVAVTPAGIRGRRACRGPRAAPARGQATVSALPSPGPVVLAGRSPGGGDLLAALCRSSSSPLASPRCPRAPWPARRRASRSSRSASTS